MDRVGDARQFPGSHPPTGDHTLLQRRIERSLNRLTALLASDALFARRMSNLINPEILNIKYLT